MGLFKDADEVYSFLGRIFEEGVKDPDLGPKFNAVGVKMKLSYSDPEATINVDFGNGIVEFGTDSNIASDVELVMATDTAHRFWLGKVNAAMALTKGDIRAKGSVPKVLKVVPITRPLYAKYEQMLLEAGRQDLVDAVK